MPNLFPQVETVVETAETTQDNQVQFGKSWRFDFEKGDFIQTPTGKVVPTKDLDAYREWCYKALLTPRYKHLIYSRSYGQEFEDLIRRNLNLAGNESEIKHIITEALMVDPRTAEVTNFKFTWSDNEVYVTFDAVTVRNETVQLETKVVTG